MIHGETDIMVKLFQLGANKVLCTVRDVLL